MFLISLWQVASRCWTPTDSFNSQDPPGGTCWTVSQMKEQRPPGSAETRPRQGVKVQSCVSPPLTASLSPVLSLEDWSWFISVPGHSWDSRRLQVTACLRTQSLQSCLTLCDPMDCSPTGSSVHGILQARILECNWSITGE